MTEQRAIVHIASTTPGKAMCGADMPKGGAPVGPVNQCAECWSLFQAYRRGKRRKSEQTSLSPEDEDLLRRAVQARNPLRGREIPPLTMTLAEMRAEAERRTAHGLPHELDGRV